ncbi:MAG: hypothetical protein ACI4N4_06380 [Candidatus Fimenecus sp.]
MNISKFEKFIIKHWVAVLVGLLIIMMIIKMLFQWNGFSWHESVIWILMIIFIAIYILVINNVFKRMKNFYSKELNPDASISLVNEYLEITKKDNDIYDKINNYFDLMTCFSAKGEYEQVIDLCTKIRRDYYKKKIDKSFDLSIRLFLALAYLNRGEKDLYDKEIEYVCEVMSKTKFTKHIISHQYTEVKLLEESLYSGNDPNFETKVFDFLYEKDSKGKQKNKKPSNIQLISAYGLLFNYYKLNANNEKTLEYANKIVKMGNGQLAVYRTAKEYLDNANSSN